MVRMPHKSVMQAVLCFLAQGLGPGVLISILSTAVLLLRVPTAWAAIPNSPVGSPRGLMLPSSAAEASGPVTGFPSRTESFTVEAYVYYPALQTSYALTLFQKERLCEVKLWYDSVYLYPGRISFGVATETLGQFSGMETGMSKQTGWHHVACTYNASTGGKAVYFDGTLQAVAFNSVVTHTPPPSADVAVKGSAVCYYVDELRVSSGIRYSANFTRPSSPFSSDGSTAALWHFDETTNPESFLDSGPNGNMISGKNDATTVPFANSPPSQPVNNSPTDGATDVPLTPTLTSSSFSDPDAGDSHQASRWRVIEGTIVKWNSGVDPVNRTSVAVPAGLLTSSTTYKWTVQYRDSSGYWSPWSSSTSFTTSAGISPAYLKITGSAAPTAGASETVTIVACDAAGNTAVSYAGPRSLTFEGAHPVQGHAPTVDTIEFGSPVAIVFADGQATASMILYKTETAEIDVSDGTINSTGSPDRDLDVTVVPAGAAALKFRTQPGDGTTTTLLNPQPVVEVQDAFGNCVTSDNSTQVGLQITSNPGGGSLKGTTTRTAQGGLATFADLSIDRAGDGYTLTAASTGLTGALSDTFTITAGATGYTLSGRARYAETLPGTVYVGIYEDAAHAKLVNEVALGGANADYAIANVGAGSYYLFAYLDANGNHAFESRSDPGGVHTGNPVTVNGDTTGKDVILDLPSGGFLLVEGVHASYWANGSATYPYKTIQSGIDAAANGETVLVEDGTYAGTGNKNLQWTGRHIAVKSKNGYGHCTIDCEEVGQAFLFDNTGQNASDSVEGFSMRKGNAYYGGAVFCRSTSPTIRNNLFSGNTARFGGSIYCWTASPVIRNNVFCGNSVTEGGGAIVCYSSSSPLIEGNVITDNSAVGDGGGISISNSSSPTLVANTISANRSAYAGAAIYCGINSSALVSNNVIAGNVARFYGAVFCDSGVTPELDNNTIAGNKTDIHGGALCCARSSSPVLTNCILWGNRASRGDQVDLLDPQSDPVIRYCDVEGGQPGITGPGGGSEYSGWGDGNINADPGFLVSPGGTWSGAPLYNPALSQTALTTSMTYALGELTGKLLLADTSSETPLQFVIAGNAAHSITVWGNASWVLSGKPFQVYDYHLGNGSPCIDSGTATGAPATDIEGHPRYDDLGMPNGTAAGIPPVDMGAYERQTASDTIPPTVTINQATGQADPTATGPVRFTVVFSEPVSDFTQEDVTVAGTAGGTKTVTVSGSGTTYTLSVSGMTSDGTVIATIAAGMAHDAAGNGNTVSTSTDKTVLYDANKPTGTISINNGAAYTTSSNVTLNLTATDGAGGSGVAWMQFRNYGGTWTGWESYAATKAWTLAAGEGIRQVFVQFKDKAGLASGGYSDTIVVDTAKPTGTIKINNGAVGTPSGDVTLNLTADDGAGSGVALMRFRNYGGTWTGWEPYATTKAWTLAAGEGIRQVFVQFKDKAGLSSVSASDTIILDAAPGESSSPLGIQDVIATLRQAVGLPAIVQDTPRPSSETGMSEGLAVDMNEDGQIDIADVLLILGAIRGTE